MLRTTKLPVLGALTLVVLGAFGATGVQAGTFTAGAYPATVKGTSGLHLLMTPTISISISCLPTFHGILSGGSESLTLTPSYGTSCKSEEQSVHISNNGCDLAMRAGSTKEADVVSGTMDVVCPLGKAIDFELTSPPGCHFMVPAQEKTSLLTYRMDTAKKTISVEYGVSKLAYVLSSKCPEAAGEYANGAYLGTSTLQATNEGLATSFLVE
jgi:hypothetical protein